MLRTAEELLPCYRQWPIRPMRSRCILHDEAVPAQSTMTDEAEMLVVVDLGRGP